MTTDDATVETLAETQRKCTCNHDGVNQYGLWFLVSRDCPAHGDAIARARAVLDSGLVVPVHLYREAFSIAEKAATQLGERDATIARVRKVHCWTNEDGAQFLFADDLRRALDGDGG